MMINYQMKRSKSGTNVIGSSERPKSKSLESVDRISVLPDSILGIMLSFLPTKNAVSTAVLSRRWKLVWTCVHNLDLCYEDSLGKQDERDDMRFVGFVNRVLLLHDAGRIIKFRLVWTPRCISSHASSWISTAIKRNVNELFLCLETHTLVKPSFSFYRGRTSPEPFTMPICVFSCNTMRFLELNGGISVSEAIEVCLPKLETIKLVSVYFQSEEAFEKLIRGCPVLINLLIIRPDDMCFHQDDDFTYIISSTSLKRLEVYIKYQVDDMLFDGPLYISLEIETPSLEYLALNGVIPIFLVKTSLSSLVEADIRIIYQFSEAFDCNSIVEVVRASDHAKFLTLSDDVMQAFRCATISLSTEFRRLVKLKTEIECCPWSSLRDFIQNSDNLDDLTIYQDSYGENNHDHHAKWTTPVEVPRCLSNSLKKVYIYGYKGMEDEHGMILYMLKHGSVLEIMQISCYYGVSDGERFELLQKIRESSKKSPACEVRL